MPDIEDIYELSPIQQGMLSDSLAVKDYGLYLIQLSYRLHGDLNRIVFEQAWQQVFARHAAMRTSFHWEGMEKPVQVVHRNVQLFIEELDWCESSETEQKEKLVVFHQENQTRGVEFTQAPLMRLVLIRMSENNFQFIWTFHHILFEGWSASLILQEVFDLYRSLLNTNELQLSLPKQYREYISWLQNQDLKQAEKYWRQQLADFMSPTSLGMGANSNASSFGPVVEFNAKQIILSASDTTALNSFARTHRLTVNTLIQAAWAYLLSVYCRNEDVVFGTIVSGRSIPLEGVESMIGLFINILPVRLQVSSQSNLLNWLKSVQEQQVAARKYEFCPLVEVKGWSGVQPGIPLFESIVIFENWLGEVSLNKITDDLAVSDVVGYNGAPGYPLAVVVEPGDKLGISITFDTNRFETKTIKRTLQHFVRILKSFTENTEQQLKDISILTGSERTQLLSEWNETAQSTPENLCIHRLFENSAERTPDAVAVVHENEQITYKELNRRANQLAALLQESGIRPEVRVGLCVNRNLSMIVGILGVLKAGGSYVPFDPEYPQARINFMIEDSGIAVLLTEQELEKSLPANKVTIICLDTDDQNFNGRPADNPHSEVEAENLAYVIYTSGSTGRPKGVMVPHRSLVNYVEAAGKKFEIQCTDRILQFASISFDTAAEEIFPALLSGATLVLRTDSMLDSIPIFWQTCNEWKITVLDFPTAYWHEVTAALSSNDVQIPESLRLVILGGERAHPEKLLEWQKHAGEHPRLFNTYGPTETTIVCTMTELEQQKPDDNLSPVSIGRAIQNAQTYVLDRDFHPVPVGVSGELFVGGAGISRGYSGRPELTGEKFVPDPFSGQAGARLYRTGDLVRYRPDGNLEFLGRIDDQVKIRGYRIEPGEIEVILRQNTEVAEAVVVVSGDERLTGYILANGNSSPTVSQLRSWLLESLPVYMVPQSFVFLDSLPRTPNGKINTAALPAPDNSRPVLNTGFVAPRNSVEEEVATIWRELLKQDRVGIYDNFFELGGHSLLAIQLLSRLRTAFKIEVPLRKLFEQPTIENLSVVIGQCQIENEDEKQMAQMLSELEGLSDEEAKAIVENG